MRIEPTRERKIVRPANENNMLSSFCLLGCEASVLCAKRIPYRPAVDVSLPPIKNTEPTRNRVAVLTSSQLRLPSHAGCGVSRVARHDSVVDGAFNLEASRYYTVSPGL